MGSNCNIERGVEIIDGCVFSDYAGLGPNNSIDPETVVNGNCMIEPNVHIYMIAHYYDNTLHYFNRSMKPNPVVVGKNVWIGYSVIILPGVTIGDNTIMRAGNPWIVKK